MAARLTLVHLKGEAELERKEAVLFEKQPDQIVRCLVQIGVDVLICGAISQTLQLMLEKAGIKVVAHICGEINAVIAAYRSGGLNRPEFIMPGCRDQRLGGVGGMPQCKRSKSARQGR